MTPKDDADAEPKEVKVIKSNDDFWKAQIEAVYRRRNPAKFDKIPELIEKYKSKPGGVVSLYRSVCKNYMLDPTKFYADPKAWGEDKDMLEDDEPAPS